MPDGSVDTTGGEQEGSTLGDQRNHLSVKFDKDVRFLLGTCCVLLPDGTMEGRRCAAFEYTNRVVLTDHDYWVRIRTEITRVKTLDGNGTPWVTGQRTDADGIFKEDLVIRLAGVGKTREAILEKQSIVLFQHVACLEDEGVKTLAKVQGLGEVRLWQIRTIAQTAHPGKFDRATVDHKKASNPYESLYGDRWIEVIKKQHT